MRLIILDDYEAVSSWAADYVAARIRDAERKADRPFVLGLPTGSSPLGLYSGLARLYAAGSLTFRNVVTFNMDEYVGIPEDHPQSYHRFMRDNLFSKIDILPGNAHIPNGNALDLTQECERYEKAISDAGGIDLFVGGIGNDGHIAFNEPGSSLASRSRVAALTRDTRIANSRFFDNDVSMVPRFAITVGIGTVMDADEILLLVSGYSKARALKEVVEGAVSHVWPASCIQMHPRGIVVCDEDAIAELKVETVRYFNDLESRELGSFALDAQ
jgi:glucosamine-6-phosphate deaminase